MKQTVVNIQIYQFLSNIQNFIQHPSVRVNPHADGITEEHQCGLRYNRSTLIIYSASVKDLRKKMGIQ